MAVSEFSVKTWTNNHTKYSPVDEDVYTAPGFSARPGVDSVLWLKRRIVALAKIPAAQLVSASDGGIVHFWNARMGQLMGSFAATKSATGGETVSSMASDRKNKVLITGDSQGYVRIWDIEGYCVDEKPCKRPKEVHGWRAHHQNVSSLIFAEANEVLISGSADYSVRLWSTTGNYIGTFGNSRWALGAAARLSLVPTDAHALDAPLMAQLREEAEPTGGVESQEAETDGQPAAFEDAAEGAAGSQGVTLPPVPGADRPITAMAGRTSVLVRALSGGRLCTVCPTGPVSRACPPTQRPRRRCECRVIFTEEPQRPKWGSASFTARLQPRQYWRMETPFGLIAPPDLPMPLLLPSASYERLV